MKKHLFLILILTILVNCYSYGQTYAFLNPGLKRLTGQKGIQVTPQALPSFRYDGVKVSKAEVMNYLMKVEYQAAIYVDAQNNPAALVFEMASEEAKAAKIKSFENYKGGDFMLNETAPNFLLRDMDNNLINLKDLKGEYVMLNFWFVGCKPCVMEMPELNELVEEFKSQGIHFLAIGLDNPERVATFLKKQEFDYTLLTNGRLVAGEYGVTSYPTHLFLDKEGKVIFSQQGYFPGLKYALRKRLLDAVEK